MNRILFELNGSETKYFPEEYKSIGITASFYPTIADFQTKLDNVRLSLEDLETIKEWISVYGYFQGIPFDVSWIGRDAMIKIFQGQIDLSDSYSAISINKVSLKPKLRGEIDWMNEVANTFSFKWLFVDKGIIKSEDFEYVPYIINYVPDTMQVIILAISLFVMVRELVGLVKEIANLATELITGASAFGFAQILAAIIKIVLLLAYAVALVLAIKELVKQLKEQLFPDIRYHWGIKASTLFKRAFEFLGYEFRSTIFENTVYRDLIVLPSKQKEGGLFVGIPRDGTPNDGALYLFGDYLFSMIELMNGSITFEQNNTVARFERRDYKKNLANFQLKSNFTDQKERYNVVGNNADELNGSFLYSFSTDFLDKNTLDNFTGTNFQVITSGITVPDKKLDNIKNHREIRPPYALGTRKEELTKLEKIYRKFAKFTDDVVSFFGGSSDFATQIDSRVGVLSLSDHSFSIPKLVIRQGSRLKSNQRNYVSARAFYDNFYCIESFVPVVDPLSDSGDKVHNQYIKKSLDKHKIDADDFVSLQNNNYVKTSDNKIALVERLNIDSIYSETAKIDFRVNEVYDQNLKIDRIEP